MRLLHLTGALASAALTGGLLMAGPADAAPTDPVDVRPERTIKGTKAGIKAFEHVELAASGRTYVTNRNRIVVYGAKARGNARPLYRIAGKRTRLSKPRSIARDKDGRLYVANGNNRVLVFGKRARGNVKPIRVLRTRAYVGLLSITPTNRLMLSASSRTTGLTSIRIYRRAASGDEKPVREIGGPKAYVNGMYDLKMNVDRRIWVPFGEEGTIWVFAPGANGDVAPERKIQGEWPGMLWEPDVLDFDRAGRAYLGLHGGEIYILPRDAAGKTTPLRVVSEARHLWIDGLSVSRTGKVAVTYKNRIVIYPRLVR